MPAKNSTSVSSSTAPPTNDDEVADSLRQANPNAEVSAGGKRTANSEPVNSGQRSRNVGSGLEADVSSGSAFDACHVTESTYF